MTIIKGVNASRNGGSSANVGSHGGNDLASILVRLSQQEKSRLVRMALLSSLNQHVPSPNTTTNPVHPPPSPLPQTTSLRVLHSQQQQRRMKRADEKQDDLIWEMLRDWMAQEQRLMAADQPPSERPAEDADAFESSGDGIETKEKSPGEKTAVVLDGGDLVGGMEQRDDDLVPAEMAVAEALILLPPAPVRLDPTTTPATDQLAVGDSSVNETAEGIDGHHLLLRPTDSSGEFAYDDH